MWRDSLSSLNTSIFHSMTKSNENTGKAKFSNLTGTPDCESVNPEWAYRTVIKLLRQLDGKVELHVHFIVNSVVVGNNVTGSHIDITSLGHTTFGDNSNCCGQTSKM
jgi:hypothetical protein